MLNTKTIMCASTLLKQQKRTLSTLQKKLFTAMLINDYDEIAKMYHEKMVFTNPAGQSVGKEPELSRYKSGDQTLVSIIPSLQIIEVWGATAVVTVETAITGAFSSQQFKGNFRYQHIWRKFRQEWKVISGCCVQVI